jgi:acyl-CoA thioester hydrolase
MERPTISAPPRPPSTLGRVRLRPRYNECDPMGVVHHAAYVPWLEMGRTELLRDSGLSYAQLEAMGVLLVIVRLEVTYKRPARYDDQLELTTRVLPTGSRVKIEHAYELALLHPATGEALAEPAVLLTAQSTLACVDRSGRPQPLPAWLAGA